MENNNKLIIKKMQDFQFIIIGDAVDELKEIIQNESKNLDILNLTENQLKDINDIKNNINYISNLIKLSEDIEKTNAKCWGLEHDFTGRKPEKLKIGDVIIESATYKECLINLCSYLTKNDESKFLYVINNMNKYFSRDEKLLNNPRRIKGTDLYVSTQMNSNNITKLMKKITDLYGLKQEVKIIIK